MSDEPKKLINLGMMNGWGRNTPEIFKKCQKQKHKLTQKNIGRCLTEYTCPICGYSYEVDSSD